MIGNRVSSIRHHIIKVRHRLRVLLWRLPLILPNLRCNGVAKDGGAVHLELSKACIESTSVGFTSIPQPRLDKSWFSPPLWTTRSTSDVRFQTNGRRRTGRQPTAATPQAAPHSVICANVVAT